MITYLGRLFIIILYLLIFVKTQTNIPIGKCSNFSSLNKSFCFWKGWFVDDTTSNDADTEVFSKALTAAINLTDQFLWPKDQFSFQSVYENVSVCIIKIILNFSIILIVGCKYLFWFSSK